MGILELKPGFYFTGALDHDLRVFDIIMYTEYGTTYNSYVLKTANHTVLFETAKAKCLDSWLEKVGSITPIDQVDYLVVSHTEPDHSGSVERLLELNPRLKIVATGCAINFLKEIVNRDFYSIAVKDGQTLELDDKTLEFMVVPNLHWPDTMYTYIRQDKVLVTCDSFGSHYACDGILASAVTDQEGYWKATKYYYDCIIGPFKSFMLDALKRVRPLELEMICPGHGPVLDTGIPHMLDTYEQWSTVINPNPRPTVIIPYVSAYGYTGQLAQAIAQGITDKGGIDVRLYDMVEADAAQVAEELLYADGFLLGTPTIVGEALKPIWDLTTGMFAGTLGVELAGRRLMYLLVVAAMVGVLVYQAGMVGFVGLIIPHGVRLLFGSDHRTLLPLAGLTGAVFLVWMDVLCRVVLPGNEIPIGILTALVGAPVFLALLARRRYGFGGEV